MTKPTRRATWLPSENYPVPAGARMRGSEIAFVVIAPVLFALLLGLGAINYGAAHVTGKNDVVTIVPCAVGVDCRVVQSPAWSITGTSDQLVTK